MLMCRKIIVNIHIDVRLPYSASSDDLKNCAFDGLRVVLSRRCCLSIANFHTGSKLDCVLKRVTSDSVMSKGSLHGQG